MIFKKLLLQTAGLFCCLLLLCVACPRTTNAQNIDSLKLELVKAKSDTAKVTILLAITDGEALDTPSVYNELAKNICEKAIAAGRQPQAPYIKGLATALNNIGYYYSHKDDLVKALEYYNASLKQWEQLNDKKSIALMLNNIASMYDALGDFNTGLAYYYRNLRVQEEIKDTMGMAYTINNIGYHFLKQKDNNNARLKFTRSRQLFEAVHLDRGTAMVLANIGITYSNEHNYPEALGYYLKSEELYEQAGLPYYMSQTLSMCGSVYEKLKKYDTAMLYYGRALKIAKELHVNSQQSYAELQIGRVLLDQDKVAEALVYAKDAFSHASGPNAAEKMEKIAELLKDIYLKKGDYKSAYEMHVLQVKMSDSLHSEAQRKATLSREYQYQYDKKEAQLKLDNERRIGWKNKVLFTVVFSAVLIVALLLFYVRNSRLKAKLDRAELEQQQYRSQMNPHFIFNCLNSIQHYIVHSDVVAANRYLSKFASLMRTTLDNNKVEAIMLNDEINYLDSYLTLEQMRFENKFAYEIKYAPNVDPYAIEILPTIIQPFAENAILHGLCPLEKDGMLSIFFEKQGQQLICKIEDNGIGRAASQGIKNTSGKVHVSHGMDLVKKRLALASTLNKKKFGVEIIDKRNADGKGSGTLVILTFPVDL